MTPKRHVIPIFVPHLGCPNDCVFCNQRRISGQLEPATPETVRRVLDTMPDIPGMLIKQLAFYGGSFTAISEHDQTALLDASQPFLKMNRNASLRISTRPDCIDKETLLRLNAYGVATIELGAQSMCDHVLKASGRGHTARDTISASQLVKQYGFELILQMMTGLPGDTPSTSIMTAQKLIELQPDGVRIYPTVVIRGTKLHEMWINGEYKEHTVEDAVSLCADLHELFAEAHIPIIRLGLNPTDDLSAGEAICGAYHPAFGEMVLSRIFLNRARLLLRGFENQKRVILGVPAKRVSAMTGQKRSNIETLQREFGIEKITVKATDVAAINDEPGEIVIMSIENDP